MTEQCNSVGELIVGGNVVGLIKCGLNAGHEQRSAVIVGDTLSELHVPEASIEPDDTVLRWEDGAPHRAVLEWDDAGVVDWPEALDPDEVFDVPVELRPDDELTMPEIPSMLCGVDGCVFYPHDGAHSWQL